jgi:hypothetical protein
MSKFSVICDGAVYQNFQCSAEIVQIKEDFHEDYKQRMHKRFFDSPIYAFCRKALNHDYCSLSSLQNEIPLYIYKIKNAHDLSAFDKVNQSFCPKALEFFRYDPAFPN